MVDNPRDDDALARRIAAARAAEPARKDGARREESQAWTIAAEFIGGMLGGAFLGWLIDRSAGSAPWGLIAMTILGFAAGLRQVLRQQTKIDGDS